MTIIAGLKCHFFMSDKHVGVELLGNEFEQICSTEKREKGITRRLGDGLCCCNAANSYHCEQPKQPCFSIPFSKFPN